MHTNFNNEDARLGASGIRGVAIYTKFGLDVQVVEVTNQHKDHVWIEIALSGKDRLLCGCVYRSPTKDKTSTVISSKLVCDVIKKRWTATRHTS